MEAVAEKLYTQEDYFGFCEIQEDRFECVDEEIAEISGDSVTANQIAGNIHFHVRSLLEDQPFIFVQNAVGLQIQENDNLLKYAEPLLIVEVLSESTAKTDRSAKLNEYRLIPSLQYYLIVDQESCFVKIYIREGRRWYVELYDKMEDTISLPYFGIEIPVKTIYKKIIFQ